MGDQEQIVFQLILFGGNGRSAALEAVAAAKQGDFNIAREKLQKAADELNEAHKLQSSLIQAEVRGDSSPVSLLMVHAQDHLMNALTIKELAAEFVDLYETLNNR
ncbi:PTS lactose/cellobiose transporter subunit IIA [Mesobacillus foraminis]|uniref:PTS system cellobiose-specific IIA component n=1 Tax=Mesobacillus foraminis TaxID=279826 RepID=A0A4R2BFH1_9BACI|nr:PTS lactose/cellobiose transporter subunit IIA [Mesobacillus foraminis]TCN25082.1 PTS system cellobiose-specific IIA component [Mesobacillus foraminis]